MVRASVFLLVCCVFVFVGGAMAAPIPLSDTSLQGFFDSRSWSIDALNDQVDMHPGWMIAETSAQASMTFWREEFGGSDIAFGIYSKAGMELAEVFDTSDTPVAAAVLQFTGSPGEQALVIQTRNAGGFLIDVQSFGFTGEMFGFYIALGEYGNYTNILYSDPTLNPGSETALILYSPSGGQYLLAGDIDGDGDFSDIVGQAESVQPLPEPATVFLLGAGLVAMAAVGRKKWTESK